MLPDEELERLAAVRGSRLTSIRLCAMRGCAETCGEPTSSGFSCATWGVILDFEPRPLAITWSDDALGDPFRIGLEDPDRFIRIDSLVQHDVSHLTPWSRYIDFVFDSFKLLTYQSNYAPQPSNTTWHAVPWGLLLSLGPHKLLAAAVRHEDPYGGAPCADELVVAYSDLAIHRLSKARDGARSEWSAI